jgi:hypothetical protein
MLSGQPSGPLANSVMRESSHRLVPAHVLYVRQVFSRRRVLQHAHNAQLGHTQHPTSEHVECVVLELLVPQEQSYAQAVQQGITHILALLSA